MAVRESVGGETALYPGSFVDIAASAAYPSVTYVDIDQRVPTFFADKAGVREIVSLFGHPREPELAFIHADYRDDLGLPVESFDLLISLYSGFVSEFCTHYLRVGGTLLVNPSHGDAAMASIDPRYALRGVVVSSSGSYGVRTDDLDTYLVPKKPVEVTPELLHQRFRGVGYTRSPFAYLFRRIR